MISTVVMYANKGDIRKTKKTEDSGAFSNVEYKHENPVAVLTMHACVNKSIIYVAKINSGQ